jgi:hypothetical protein
MNTTHRFGPPRPGTPGRGAVGDGKNLLEFGGRCSVLAVCVVLGFALVLRGAPPIALPGAAQPLTVVGQATSHGHPTKFAADAITFTGNGDAEPKNPQRVAVTELVSWGVPTEFGRRPSVVTADGGTFAAETVACTAETLEFVSGLLGSRIVPLAQVRGVVFRAPASTAARDRLFDSPLAAVGDRDRLLLVGGDELQGTLTSLDARHAALETSVGPVQLELSRLAAVLFNPALAAKPSSAGVRLLVGLRDGSLLTCRTVVGDGDRVRLTPLFAAADAAPWECDAAEITFLQTLGGRATYLSDLEPAGYKHVPYLELSRPYRFDRSTDGGFLRAGGRRYMKGIGMHSTSRLTFPLDPAQKRFEAEIAVDDGTAGQGSVTFRVFVDAEERFRSDVVRGGDSPRPIAVDVAGGRQLSLIVDFAERGDEQDHADWLNARLTP